MHINGVKFEFAIELLTEQKTVEIFEVRGLNSHSTYHYLSHINEPCSTYRYLV
jgi:hypothetical protein